MGETRKRSAGEFNAFPLTRFYISLFYSQFSNLFGALEYATTYMASLSKPCTKFTVATSLDAPKTINKMMDTS